MSLRIEFIGHDGAQASEIVPLSDGDRFPLPRLLIAGPAEIWIERAAITGCDVDPADGALADSLAGPLAAAVTAAWQPAGPQGHGIVLMSEQAWLPAAAVTAPARVTVHWQVTYYQTGPYERFLNSEAPSREEASVTVNFEPRPAPGQAGPSTEPDPQRPAGPAHLGHVAIDFGTSNATATLFDQQILPSLLLSEHQVGKLRDDTLTLIAKGPGVAGSALTEFRALVTDIARTVLAGAGNDPTGQLADELKDDDDRDPRLLYAVLLELERWVERTSEQLRPALAYQINASYEQAWQVPPLDRLRLFRVSLDINEDLVLESKATATLNPLRVSVGAPRFEFDADEDGPGEPLIYAGLKQRLGDPEPHPELGEGATSDDLIRESLRNLLDRCNAYIATGSRELGQGRVDNVVITYPTMATPAVRHQLRELLHELGVSIVDTSFDEAIAAALFILMRDFGGDHDTGLELLRSRSRELRPGRWRQTLLVIDIGGGTTDVALLNLNLRDETPEGAGDPARSGRYYELLPEVLGSTGRLQLGGELTTLRVFYWIKASVGDRLLELAPGSFTQPVAALRQLAKGDPGPQPFRRRTARDLPKLTDGSGTGGDVFGYLDDVVHTRSAPGNPRPGQAFWLLWALAERVKREFYAADGPAEITIAAADIERVLAATRAATGATGAGATGPDGELAITLDRETFERLVTPDLDDVMQLAHQLAAQRLGEEPIDRIILTGQASSPPLVRSRLLSVFEHEDRERGRSFRWHPSAVTVEHGFAKPATSLGACWASSNRGLAYDSAGAIRRLREGRNEFRIDVDNLFFNLPCTFLRGTTPGGQRDDETLLAIGAELYQVYPDQDVAVIRSEPFQLTDYVGVFRDGHGERPRWGNFQWRRVEPKPRTGIWPRAINARLEATSGLDLFLLLYRSDQPHYLVQGRSVPVRDALRAAWGDTAADLDPARIEVNAYATDGDHEGVVVFPRPAASADEPELPVFDETFHPSADESGTPVAGRISEPLPLPPVSGIWTFHYRDDELGLIQLGELPLPPREGQLSIRYHATVDVEGNLRVHAGEVPYWPAGSLQEVEERSGSVYRTPMDSTSKEYDPARDPFNGRH